MREPAAAEVAAAASAAAAAFAAESRRRTFSDAELLRRVADALEERRTDVCGVAERETGLDSDRLQGELTRTTGQLAAFAGLADSGAWLDPILDRADPQATPPKPDQRRMNVAVGPVAVFTASNFPFAFGVAGGDTASAFAAGCPVIVKGHPGHPETSRLLASCVENGARAAGVPPAWFAHVQGADHATSSAVVEAEAIKAVSFTGSLQGGIALARIAAARANPIPVYAEMGSSNPLFVTSRAAAARGGEIAEGLAASVTGSSGQLCTKPGLVVLVEDESGRRLAARLEAKLRARSAAAMLGSRIASGFRDALDSATGDERTRVVVAPAVTEPGLQAPALIEVDASSLAPGDPLLEEIFGPAALVVWAKDDDDLVAAAELIEGSLTATVHAEPGDSVAAALLATLARRAGRLVFNGFPTGVMVGWATMHGGPFPATTSAAHTSVGMTAIRRFVRPVGYQSVPDELLPPGLQDANPLGLLRLVDGDATRDPVER